MSDGQVKGDDGVAARCVGQRIGDGVDAFSVGHAVDPGEAVASVVGVREIRGLVDGEVEGGDTVAFGDDGSQRVGEDCVGCGSEMEVEAVVGVAGADVTINVNSDDRVHIQVHGQYAVGTRGGSALKCDGAVSSRIEFHPVPSYRQIILANGGVSGIADITVDGQNECNGGVASEDVGGILGVSARCIIVDAVEYVRQVVLVDSDFKDGVR